MKSHKINTYWLKHQVFKHYFLFYPLKNNYFVTNRGSRKLGVGSQIGFWGELVKKRWSEGVMRRKSVKVVKLGIWNLEFVVWVLYFVFLNFFIFKVGCWGVTLYIWQLFEILKPKKKDETLKYVVKHFYFCRHFLCTKGNRKFCNLLLAKWVQLREWVLNI